MIARRGTSSRTGPDTVGALLDVPAVGVMPGATPAPHPHAASSSSSPRRPRHFSCATKRTGGSGSPGSGWRNSQLSGTADQRASHGQPCASSRRSGQVGGRPVNRTTGRYLLTGLGQCGICAGGMFVHTRGPLHRGSPTYGCMTYHTRGRVVCANNLEVALADAERAVLSAVADHLLCVDVLETGLYKAMTAVTRVEAPATPRQALRAELARLEAEISRLAAAIAAGGQLESLVGLLRQAGFSDQRGDSIKSVPVARLQAALSSRLCPNGTTSR